MLYKNFVKLQWQLCMSFFHQNKWHCETRHSFRSLSLIFKNTGSKEHSGLYSVQPPPQRGCVLNLSLFYLFTMSFYAWCKCLNFIYTSIMKRSIYVDPLLMVFVCFLLTDVLIYIKIFLHVFICFFNVISTCFHLYTSSCDG